MLLRSVPDKKDLTKALIDLYKEGYSYRAISVLVDSLFNLRISHEGIRWVLKDHFNNNTVGRRVRYGKSIKAFLKK